MKLVERNIWEAFFPRICRRKIKYLPICRCSPPENWLHPYDENTPETNKGARKQQKTTLASTSPRQASRNPLCRKKTKRLWFSNARVSQTLVTTGQANGYLPYLLRSHHPSVHRLVFPSQSTPAMLTSVSSMPPAGFPPLRVRSLRSSKDLRSLSILIFVIWTFEGWMPTCTVLPV